MKLQPLRDQIAVLQDPERDDVTTMGIIIKPSKGIVTSQVQIGRTGQVVACGPDVDLEQLAIGDRIAYGEFMYPEYREDGITYLVMRDKDIVGVIEAEAAW